MRLFYLFVVVAAAALFVRRGFATEAIKFNESQLVSGDLRREQRPEYPVEARQHHETGSGIFILNITDENGRVESIEIRKSTGHRILDAACLKVLKTLRFKPHKVTRVWMPITFSMHQN
jgi:TonB family protein